MARGRVTGVLHVELGFLQLDVGGHPLLGVPAGQLEHRRVEGVESGERDELELVAHGTELLLEPRDRGVVEVSLPVERG